MGKFVAYLFAVAMAHITQAVYLPEVLAEYQEVIEAEETTGYIYLGDSRFVGMNKAVHMDEEDHTYVVAEVGKGYYWMKGTAIPEVYEIMDEDRDVDEWVIISGLGINDTHNVDRYIEYYNELSNDAKIILLSVNPVDQIKCDIYGYDFDTLCRGAAIFNTKLRDTEFEYIDSSNQMKIFGYETMDGVHYTDETYEFIYDIIQGYLKKSK